MTQSDSRKNRAGESVEAAGVTASEPRVEIDSEVTRCIRQHARSNSKTEVCGVLIGETTNDTIEIRASIEGLNAAQAGTHVTFTQDAWEAIYRVKDELYPEERIVGWYHSHPGFGVFLSEHDMFIQQNFFSSPGRVAWVYDPHSDEEGCFGWVSGEVHRLSSLSVVDRNGDGVERTPKRPNSTQSTLNESEDESFVPEPHARNSSGPRRRWAGVFFTHLSALLIGFAVAYLLFPRILAVMIDPVTGDFIVRDGSGLLPYLDQRIPLPQNLRGAQPAAPTPPPSSTVPAPAKPANPGSHQ